MVQFSHTPSVAAGPVLGAALALAPAAAAAALALLASSVLAAAAALPARVPLGLLPLHGEERLLAQLLLQGVGVNLLVVRRGLQME